MSSNKKQRLVRRKNRTKMSGKAKIPLYVTTGHPAIREVLAYHATLSLTEPAAGAGQYQTYRLNSIYDPDFTGVGTTVDGYSQKALFYGRYKVWRARAHITFAGSSGGNTIVGIIPSTSSAFTASPTLWPMQPNALSTYMQGNTGTFHSIKHIDREFDLPKLAGVLPSQYNTDSAYGAIFGANPAINVYLTVWLQGQTGAAQTVILDVRIAYDVEFSQPLSSIPL